MVDRSELIAVEIVGSEAFMWLMAGGEHTQVHVDTLRPAFEAWLELREVDDD